MKQEIDLSVDFCGVKLKNPLILASGIMGTSTASLSYVVKNGAGAVSTKSIGPYEKSGHTSPVVVPWEAGLINAVGLSNCGIDQSLKILEKMLTKLKAPVIVSFFADTIDNFIMVAEKIASLKPQFVEVNASCPNIACDFGIPFALDKKALTLLTRQVRKVLDKKIKMIVKLAPNVPSIAEMGKIIESEGADAICAINTIPGMIIDIYAKRPILTNKTGGISGKAIRPVAVKAVYDLSKAVKIPIIGVGGIQTGEDALEMIMAGATVVGIGSAVYFRGINVFSKINLEMREIMRKENIINLSQIKGIVHAQ